MGSNLPPQRRRPGGVAGVDQRRSLSPSQGAQEAAKRLGLTCFYAGQHVPGMVGCVACQFQIRNRGVLPACPQCGELVWAWMESGPAPQVEGAGAPPAASEPSPPQVEEGVSLEPTIKVESISIELTS